MNEQETIERLEAKVDALEEALSYQTQLLEAQQERDRQRRIWFWIKLGILVVLAVLLIPRGMAFLQEREAFAQQTAEQLSVVAETMESLQTILAPLEELMSKWRVPW